MSRVVAYISDAWEELFAASMLLLLVLAFVGLALRAMLRDSLVVELGHPILLGDVALIAALLVFAAVGMCRAILLSVWRYVTRNDP